jgi:ankyrin repeat protein
LKSGYYGDALQAASAVAHVQVVRLLIDAGASVSVQGGHRSSALSAALLSGSLQVVRMLLDSGTVIDRRNEGHNVILKEEYCKVLHVVSAGGRDAVVKRLLNVGQRPG